MLNEKEAMSHPAKATPQSPTTTPVTHETLMQDLESLGKSIDKLHDTNAALQAENAELRELVKAAIKITNGNMPEKWRNEAEQALTRPPESRR